MLIIRVPLVGTQVIFEDARSLATGAAIPERSAYLHKDIRGSVVAETYPDGSAGHVLDHGPWGETITGPSRTRHHFVDHEADPFFGAYSFGVRNYDPTLRRWTSPDPLFFVSPENEPEATSRRQLNLYSYAGNDPVNNIDSTGNFVETALDVASFAASVNTVRNWNSKTSFWTKVVDVVAVVADGAAVVVPGAPAVVGHTVRGTRAITNAAKGADRAVDVAKTVDKGVDVARGADRAADASKAGRGSVGGKPASSEHGTFYVDPKGNVVPTPQGGSITGSPDGRFIQARDATGKETGVRLDGPHKPSTHPDPRGQRPHGHVPGVKNPDGTPWLPLKE